MIRVTLFSLSFYCSDLIELFLIALRYNAYAKGIHYTVTEIFGSHPQPVLFPQSVFFPRRFERFRFRPFAWFCMPPPRDRFPFFLSLLFDVRAPVDVDVLSAVAASSSSDTMT